MDRQSAKAFKIQRDNDPSFDLSLCPKPVTADLFGLPPIGDIPDDVARGLATLATSAPIGSIGANQWAAMVSVQAFAAVHDATARRHGRGSPGLYGLSKLAPWADRSRMGAGWFVAQPGHRVAGIDALGILLIGAGGGRLRLYRTAPDEHAVLAWQLRAPWVHFGLRLSLRIGACCGLRGGLYVRTEDRPLKNLLLLSSAGGPLQRRAGTLDDIRMLQNAVSVLSSTEAPTASATCILSASGASRRRPRPTCTRSRGAIASGSAMPASSWRRRAAPCWAPSPAGGSTAWMAGGSGGRAGLTQTL